MKRHFYDWKVEQKESYIAVSTINIMGNAQVQDGIYNEGNNTILCILDIQFFLWMLDIQSPRSNG